MSSEESMQRYECAVCMAVSSVKLVIKNLSADQLTSNRKLWEDLLAKKKLWALTKHASASVIALFKLKGQACQSCTALRCGGWHNRQVYVSVHIMYVSSCMHICTYWMEALKLIWHAILEKWFPLQGEHIP